MKSRTILFFVNIVIFFTGISCSTVPRSNIEIANQEEPVQYQKSLHYIALDKENRIIVASIKGLITRIDDIEGKNRVTFGTWGTDKGNFRTLLGVAVDSKNRIYVVDQKNQRLVRIDDVYGNGWITFDFTSGDLNSLGIRGLCIDTYDRIYISDEAKHKIIRMDDIEGNNLVQFGSYGSGEMQFASPYTLDIDSLGRIYIADGGNNRIVRVDDMSGAGWVTFGKDGKGVGEFHRTYGVALNEKDQIIISDGNGRFVQIDDMNGLNWREIKPEELEKGIPLSLAGVQVDSQQRILYIDYDNARICRIDSIDGDGFISYTY